MNARLTWRDTVVDVVALLVLCLFVLLKYWTPFGAAPWIIAIVTGRWGLTSVIRYAVAQKDAAEKMAAGKAKSLPPPPLRAKLSETKPTEATPFGAAPAATPPESAASEEVPESEVEKVAKKLPSSMIVLVLFGVFGAVSHVLEILKAGKGA